MRILWKSDQNRSTGLAPAKAIRKLLTICLLILCVAVVTGFTFKDRKTRSSVVQRDCWEDLKAAAEFNRVDELKKLLADDSGCKSRKRPNNKEWTLLHWAAWRGSEEATVLLLDSGACINCQADAGVTALSIAAGGRHLGVVLELLGRGADVNLAEKDGWTALHSAVSESGDTFIIGLLLQYGAKVNPTNEYKSTPLHFAVVKENTEAAELLLQRGADVNARDTYGRTPLHYSIDENDLPMIQLLLKSGADLKIKDKEGHDAHATAKASAKRVIELLNKPVK